jgi:hypothetical protein
MSTREVPKVRTTFIATYVTKFKDMYILLRELSNSRIFSITYVNALCAANEHTVTAAIRKAIRE